MAALVTEDEVRAILDDPDPSIGMSSFIDQADLIITEDLATAGLSDARLKMIELNLAAHFFTVAIERGGLTYQKGGDSEEGYKQVLDEGLASTRYGQQAIFFDKSGTLQTMASPAKRAEFRVMNVDRCTTSSGG